jgi:type IV pilus assembly protein PilM
MAKRVTTLFIRDTGINLLVMKGEQVEKWADSPLEPGLVSQGLIVDEEEVAERVKQLFKEEKVKTDKVTVGLSGRDSLYRVITLPDLPEAVLPEAVRREAKRTIPTPLEEVYVSYQRLPESGGENRIFLATFPRNLVDALVRTLRKAGVKPYVMDLAPLALCRIPDEPRSIIVNARLDHLDIMVVADRVPELIRTLSLSGEAEPIEDKLPLISEELDRSVAFYNSTHMERPLDSSVPVFVSGELAEAPDTWQSLVGESGYSASPLPSPVEPLEEFNPNEFMVNMGLALKELRPERPEANFSLVNFNALPEAYVPPSFSIVRVLVPVGIVVGVGIVVFVGISVLHNRTEIDTLRSAVTIAERNVAQEQQDVTALGTEATSTKSVADTLRNTLTNLQRDRATIHEDLQEIHSLAGEVVSLATVSHKGGSVTVTGAAPDVDEVFGYARELRECGRFSSVWVSSISGDGTSFSFALTK